MRKVNQKIQDQMHSIGRRQAMTTFSLGALAAFLPAQWAEAQRVGLRGYLRTNWSRDPLAFGSYAYIARGARQKDCSVLGESVQDRLFFAGEATHARHNSTVHAAYETGVSAAQEVLETGAKRVAIIGAGISGLTAAYNLVDDAGLEVTVFEARSRIGGRVWTSRDLGIPLDLGASWIHGTRRNPINKLANEVDAALVPTDEEYVVRGKDGRRIKENDAPDWLDNVVSVQHNAGADDNQLNMQAYMAQPEYGGEEVIFAEGYDTILEALSEDYKLRLSEAVTTITYNESGVTLTTRKGDSEFDAVIVTLPLGVLKQGTVKFVPDLPTRKQRSIERLGMGTLDKLYLQFEDTFWDEEATWIVTPENGLPRGQFNQWLNLTKYLNEPIIMAFNGGPPALALSSLSDKQITAMAVGALRVAYPKL